MKAPGVDIPTACLWTPSLDLDPYRASDSLRRIHLVPGEKASVQLTLRASELSHWDVRSQAWVVEPGPVEVLVGRSSRDADLKSRRTILIRP